jgi:hypothetical protein
LQVLDFLHYSSTDRPRVVHGQPAAGGQSARGRGPFGGPFRQNRGFSASGVFCTTDSPRLSSGQSAPSPADSPRQLGRHSNLYAETCHVRSVPLLRF